jgi:hypothetical protein
VPLKPDLILVPPPKSADGRLEQGAVHRVQHTPDFCCASLFWYTDNIVFAKYHDLLPVLVLECTIEIDAGPTITIEALNPPVFVCGSVRNSLEGETALKNIFAPGLRRYGSTRSPRLILITLVFMFLFFGAFATL